MKKLILTGLVGLTIVLFSGCSENEIDYIDANGSVINKHSKYEQIDSKNKIVCDNRGYAYYEYFGPYRYDLTPILKNKLSGGTWAVIQVSCEDL